MDDPFEKGWLLLEQKRPDLAEQEARARIAENLESAEGYVLLARALDTQKRGDEAATAARRAIELDPDSPFIQFHFADVMFTQKGCIDEAESAIDRAIENGALWASVFTVKAHIRLEREDWEGAIQAAERGLELDADNIYCLNARATALIRVGRLAEASGSLGTALERDPENPHTHANRGWSLLHAGDAKQALVHFKEALRLDPNLGHAKEGMLEALRARNWVYRRILLTSLWIGKYRWPAIIAGIVVMALLVRGGEKFLTAISGHRLPAAILSGLFSLAMIMFSFGRHVATTVLGFHPLGRMALDPKERWISTITTVFGLAASVAIGWFAFVPYLWILMTGMSLWILAFVVAQDYPPQDRKSWWIRGAVTVGFAGVFAWFVAQAYEINREQFAAIDQLLEMPQADGKLDREAVKKMDARQKEELILDRLRGFVQRVENHDRFFAEKRAAVLRPFRIALVIGLLIGLFRNPLETKLKE